MTESPNTSGQSVHPPGGAAARFIEILLESDSLDDLLGRAGEMVAELGAFDVVELWISESTGLHRRSSLGLETAAKDDVDPVAPPVPSEPNVWKPVPLPSQGMDRFAKAGVRQLFALALVGPTDSMGALYAGTKREEGLPEAATKLVEPVLHHLGAAMARLSECDTLRHGIRSRDAVMSVVAHDLRNPLNVISLAANSLVHRLPDSSARKSIDRILRGAERADRLIQDLLEVNTIEGGRFTIERHPVETPGIILAALESQQSLAAKASIIISTDISPGLPSIEADEERILEVIENLVGNAIKFTGPGGVVTVGAAARPKEILFWVKDTGSGIRPDQVPHLFDRFWQANKRDRRGTGLGLTICKAIVEAHGGQIWPETKVKEGTTMFFTIPITGGTHEAAPIEIANILLVDDRPENLLSLKAILERPDYRLVTASSGEEALRVVLRQPFAVALVDIAMPGMTGLEVATHMKELDRSRDIPIIFITAFGDDPQEIHRAYSAGGADYLVKPLDSEIVRKKVAVFVDLNRRRRQNQPPPAET